MKSDNDNTTNIEEKLKLPTSWFVGLLIVVSSITAAWTFNTFQIGTLSSKMESTIKRIEGIESRQEIRTELLIRMDQRLLRIEEMLKQMDKNKP